MSDPPIPRHVHEAVGGFMVIMLLLLLVFAVRSAFLHHWFASSQQLKVRMPPEGSFGLVESSEVIVLGTRAGFVDRITFDERGRMHAILEIREDFAPYVRSRSEILIRKTFGIAGATYLAIVGNEGREVDWETFEPEARPDRTTTERLDEVLERIGNTLLPAIQEFQQGIERWSEVADYLCDPQRDFGPLLDELRIATRRLNEGQGAIGRLLSDEQLGSDIRDIVTRVNELTQDAAVVATRLREDSQAVPELLASLQTTLADLQFVSAKLRNTAPQALDGIQDAADQLPGLVLQAQEAVRDIELLAEALRERFAPGSVTPRTNARRVSPEDAVP